MRRDAILLAMLLLCGCSASEPTTSSVSDSAETSSLGRIDGPVLTSPPPELTSTRTSYNADVSGIVVYDSEKNCLYLESTTTREEHPQGGQKWPVIWPGGTEWRSDPPGVRLPGGEIAEPGMIVSGGGGWFDLDFVRGIAGPEVAEAAAACGGTSIAAYNIGWGVKVVED